MKKYTAFFKYGKNSSWSQDFDANSKAHAAQLAKEFVNKDNYGEPKSERSRFDFVREIKP